MNFKRYFGKIKKKKEKYESKTMNETEENIVEEIRPKINKVDVNNKKTLSFVNSNKDPHEYIRRYLMESNYKDWFNRNYPNYTIYDAVGLSISDYLKMKRELLPESSKIDEEKSDNIENLLPKILNQQLHMKLKLVLMILSMSGY